MVRGRWVGLLQVALLVRRRWWSSWAQRAKLSCLGWARRSGKDTTSADYERVWPAEKLLC